MAAAIGGNVGVCEHLLAARADTTPRNALGHTALDLAVAFGHDAAAALLNRGAASEVTRFKADPKAGAFVLG